jgi:hypothetical protein
MGALPDLAPIGEDHVLRSSSVVQKVSYSPGRITYKTFDSEGTAVLRIKFKPARIIGGSTPLAERSDLKEPGYSIEIKDKDYITRITWKGASEVLVEGK